MKKLLEAAINKDGKIRIPGDICLPWEVKIYITETCDTVIHAQSSQCMFCGGRERLIHIHRKAVCADCREAILNNEFTDLGGEVVITGTETNQNQIVLPPDIVRVFHLNSVVLLIINSDDAEITIIPAVRSSGVHCSLCGISSGTDKNLYKLGKEYFCFDCLSRLQAAA